MKTICFTGHRPDKLFGYDLNNAKYNKLRQAIIDVILNIMHNEKDSEFKFITGGALGIDQLSFDILSQGREFSNNNKITLEIAVPFKDQPIKWFNKNDIKRYEGQLEDADIITYVDKLEDYRIKGYAEDKYYPAKMQRRNEYMVNNSDIVIAVWDGTRGGTYNCVKYAELHEKEIVYINPKSL